MTTVTVEVKPADAEEPYGEVSENTIRRVNFALGNLSSELYGTSIKFVRGRKSFNVRFDTHGQITVERMVAPCETSDDDVSTD